jgi:hypothetical protein
VHARDPTPNAVVTGIEPGRVVSRARRTCYLSKEIVLPNRWVLGNPVSAATLSGSVGQLPAWSASETVLPHHDDRRAQLPSAKL